MAVLMVKRIPGAIMVGILFTTFISWIPNTEASYLGASSQIPGGEQRMEFFKQGVTLPTLSQTWLAYDWSGFGSKDLWVALITFLYLDFLDATGTLFSMANFMGRTVPGFMDEKGMFPRQTMAFCTDGLSIVFGSMVGVSPLTCYIESATGIKEGGRTGITAVVVAVGFFVALFLTPILASIPPYATGPALILVGALMMENARDINWHVIKHAVPAFITIALMPLTYSIAYGIVGGLGVNLAIWLMVYVWDVIGHLCMKRGAGYAFKYSWTNPSGEGEDDQHLELEGLEKGDISHIVHKSQEARAASHTAEAAVDGVTPGTNLS